MVQLPRPRCLYGDGWLLWPQLPSLAPYRSSIVSMCLAQDTCGAAGSDMPAQAMPRALSRHSQPFVPA